MQILLAPSEGKTAPASGPPLALGRLSHSDELTAARERVLDALVRLSAGRSRKRALDALGLSKTQAGELERNAGLREAPTAPAGEVYTGVLYQHLALAELGSRARSRAADQVLVASALFGVVGLGDPIPAYRLSIGARIPALRKGLPAFWRPALARALPDEPGELVLDLRSGSYAAAWAPRHAAVVSIRAVTPEGKVISHMAKATRGRVARAVLEARTQPREPEAVAALAGPGARVLEAPGGWTVEVVDTNL
ncbi:MAG TPA: peroxide stress protein YaaA [Thermoleophilaceae bacterium]|nr:peroxide stress protein YaaA [Thermoleophilaceae bacterium]